MMTVISQVASLAQEGLATVAYVPEGSDAKLQGELEKAFWTQTNEEEGKGGGQGIRISKDLTDTITKQIKPSSVGLVILAAVPEAGGSLDVSTSDALFKALAPSGTLVILPGASADGDRLSMDLLLAGFVNIQTRSANGGEGGGGEVFLVAERPPWEVGASAKLKEKSSCANDTDASKPSRGTSTMDSASVWAALASGADQGLDGVELADEDVLLAVAAPIEVAAGASADNKKVSIYR